MTKTGHHIIRSNGGCRVPYDYSEYGTCFVLVRCGAPVHLEVDDGRTGVEAAAALLGGPFHFHSVSHAERSCRLRGTLEGDARHLHRPYRGLQPVSEIPHARLHGLHRVQPSEKGPVRQDAYVLRIAVLSEAELEVLRLAGHPCRGGTVIGAPRVRREPR